MKALSCVTGYAEDCKGVGARGTVSKIPSHIFNIIEDIKAPVLYIPFNGWGFKLSTAVPRNSFRFYCEGTQFHPPAGKDFTAKTECHTSCNFSSIQSQQFNLLALGWKRRCQKSE